MDSPRQKFVDDIIFAAIVKGPHMVISGQDWKFFQTQPEAEAFADKNPWRFIVHAL
jgi:hypothetical protein